MLPASDICSRYTAYQNNYHASSFILIHTRDPVIQATVCLASFTFAKYIYELCISSACYSCHKFYAILLRLTRLEDSRSSSISLKCIIILNILITQMDILEANNCQNMSFIKMYQKHCLTSVNNKYVSVEINHFG